MRPSNKTKPSLKHKPQHLLRHGLGALLHRNWPEAYACFRGAYLSPDWQTRDLAIAGLGDMLDLRVSSGEKKPMLALALGQAPAATPPPLGKKLLDARRLSVLLEYYPQAGAVQVQNLNELKYMQALRAAQGLMEGALLHDPSTYVRLSSLMLLLNLFSEERQVFVLPALQTAAQQETDPALKLYLQEALGPGGTKESAGY